MGSEQVEAAQGGMPPRSGDEPFVDNGLNEAAGACDESCARRGSIGVRVSYAGECSIEEAVSRYLAARENVRDVIGEEPA